MRIGYDFIGVGVGALIVGEDEQVFLAQRGPGAKNERGFWEFPGGMIEFGETMATALRREMQEEFGVEIEVGDLLDVVDHILPEENQHWISPSFICRILNGSPVVREPEKCTAIGWFAIDEFPKKLTKITSENFKSYKTWLTTI